MTPAAPLGADAVFRRLVAEGSPVALAQAVQNRTAAALRLLSRRALVAALGAPEELDEAVRRRLEDEIAFRLFTRAARRFDGPDVRAFLAATFPPEDPVHDALARLAPPTAEPGAIAAHEDRHLRALRELAAAATSRAAPAAARAAEALSLGRNVTVAPIVTSFRGGAGPRLLAGLVLRAALDLRVARDRPEDVVFRDAPTLGRRFKKAAARAQDLAAEVTGDRRYFRVVLRGAPVPLALDGPSAGLAVFAATALAATHRNPPPPWIGFSGAFDRAGHLAPSGSPLAKVRAAAAGGVRALFLPEAAREALAGRQLPIAVVFLPPIGRDELFERIEREIAALAPSFLRVREPEARRIYSRGEDLFTAGRKEAEAEFAFLVRALEGHDETNALATLGACALARRGRCESRRGDVPAAARSFEEVKERFEALVDARRLEREGREALAELGVWKAINLLDFRDFAGALAAVEESLRRKHEDPYTTNHSLARSHGTRGIVRYSLARTILEEARREELFVAAERDLEANLERVQAFDRGRVQGYLGTLALYRGRPERAEALFRHVLGEERSEEGSRAVNPRWAVDGLAHALYDLGRGGAGRAVYEEAIVVSQKPVDPGIDQEIPARLFRWRGAALRELGRFPEAREALGRAWVLLEPWPEGHPKRALAVPVWIEIALLERAAGRADAAAGAARTARAICESFAFPTLRDHFAPTVASIDRGELEPALGRLIP